MGRGEAGGRRGRNAGRQAPHRAREGPAGEPRLRNRTSELRHERLLQQPGAGADRTFHQQGQIPETGLYAAEAARRESGRFAPGETRREAHAADAGASVISGYRRAGTIQVRPLSLLSSEQSLQLVQKTELALSDLDPRGREVEPGGAIDLGEFLSVAGLGRPFHLEGIAADRIGIAVALDGPSMHNLSAGLP